MEHTEFIEAGRTGQEGVGIMNLNRKAEIEKAREIDARIAAAWTLYHDVNDKIIALQKEAKYALKMSASSLYFGESKNAIRMKAYWGGKMTEAMAKIEKIQPEADALYLAADQLNKDLYEGWSRFFLVKHIHRSQHCSSFRPRTRVGWLPNLSGQTEAEAVAEHGAILCTICYPSAPIEWTRGNQDPNVCTGAGKGIDRKLPIREGYYAGNWATCPDCGARVGIAKSGIRIPKHKKAA